MRAVGVTADLDLSEAAGGHVKCRWPNSRPQPPS